jgi:molybdopterin converting factor small subunit
MPRISFTRNLRRHVDTPDLEVEGSTVREVLDAAFAAAPRVRDYVLDEQGVLRKHVVVFVNGEQVADRAGLGDAVPPGADVRVMQALSGG